MIVYAVFTLFFVGAVINCAVAAAHYSTYNYHHHLYNYGYREYYQSRFPSAIVATVSVLYSPSNNTRNSPEDEIANVNFLYDDIVHAL